MSSSPPCPECNRREFPHTHGCLRVRSWPLPLATDFEFLDRAALAHLVAEFDALARKIGRLADGNGATSALAEFVLRLAEVIHGRLKRLEQQQS